MSWEEGPKAKKPRENWHKKIEALEGDLDEEQAIFYFCNFLKENPTFAVDLIMGVKLYPFQAMMVRAMMECDYTLGVMGRGLSKSFTTSIFVVLHAIFNQGVQIGIMSKTFRQSKMIITKILEIAKKAEAALLKQCITNFSKSSDQWEIEIGESKIIALPLGDGEKLRGFRFQCIVVDEFLLMPESIVNEVIIPFLGVVPNPTERRDLREAEQKLIAQGKMTEEDRFVWPNNKLIALSSASYTFEYLYKMYCQYEKQILGIETREEKERRETLKLNGSSCIFHLSCEMAPQDLYDANLIEKAKTEMSESQYSREFLARFTDDSSGYFKISKMEACTVPDGLEPAVEIIGDPKEEYVVSFDPSWAENESSDDFAIHLIRIGNAEKNGVVVHTYARSGGSLQDHIKYFKYVLTNFNIVMAIGDYNGGDVFVKACNESSIFKDAGINVGIIDADIETDEGVAIFKQRYNKTTRNFCILQRPSSSWIRSANEQLQAAFDHRSIWFAARSSNENYRTQLATDLPMPFIFSNLDDIKDDVRARRVDFIENIFNEVTRTKIECATIVASATPQGTMTFDLPQNLKRQTGPNRARKDSYSALVLGNWGLRTWFKSKEVKTENVQSTFTPFFA